MNPLKWLLNKLPSSSEVDPANAAGWGPFRLPARCKWMQRAAALHDWEFDNAEKEGKQLSQVDWDLFRRWSLEANAELDPIKRCRMAKDICTYWPYARGFGRYLWDGRPKDHK